MKMAQLFTSEPFCDMHEVALGTVCFHLFVIRNSEIQPFQMQIIMKIEVQIVKPIVIQMVIQIVMQIVMQI